jgi:hypothetical protein
MCVQWLSIGVLVLKKPATEFLMIYCLNKSFGGLYRFKVLLNNKIPFLLFIPFFLKWLQSLVKDPRIHPCCLKN